MDLYDEEAEMSAIQFDVFGEACQLFPPGDDPPTEDDDGTLVTAIIDLGIAVLNDYGDITDHRDEAVLPKGLIPLKSLHQGQARWLIRSQKTGRLYQLAHLLRADPYEERFLIFAQN